MRTASGAKVAHAVVPGASAEALDLLGGALDDDVADAQAHAVAFRGQAVHGARQAVEAVARRLQRDADLPGVDGHADPPRGRLGRAHHPAGVERDLDAAVGAARQQVAAGEGGHEGVGRVRHELGRGALLAQAPVHDDPDAVGQRGGVAEVVGHEQRRAAPGRRARPAARRARPCACGRPAPRAARRGAGPAGRGPGRGPRPRAGARRPTARQGARRPGGRSARGPAARARGRRSLRRRRRWRAPSCAGRARTPGRRGRPSAARAAGRPWPRRRTTRGSPRAMRPRSGRRSPAIARSTVVLPAPEGPTSATVWAPMLRLTPSSNERRATAMSSSSFSTRRASCRTAARRR